MTFQNKNILIVGASSGIGLSLAKRLLTDGANIFTASRHNNPVLSGSNFIAFDAVKDDVDALSKSLPENLHGVVYCPGSINLKPFNRLTLTDFQNDLNINLLGAVKVLQASFKALKNANGASVVLFGTVAASTGMGFHASIAAAKSAVEGLGKSLAAEWATNKITVNIIAPSLTDTPLAANLLGSPEKREASGKRHPLGRVGSSDEVAAAVQYLLSADASWITGQVLKIDGGLSAIR